MLEVSKTVTHVATTLLLVSLTRFKLDETYILKIFNFKKFHKIVENNPPHITIPV